jgi:hypothetical protein
LLWTTLMELHSLLHPRYCEPTGRPEGPPDDRLREAIHFRRPKKEWIASAYAQGRFGGLQARHSSHAERRRVVASLLAMTRIEIGAIFRFNFQTA